MQEEFHGIYQGNNVYIWQQLYEWGTIDSNVWLPSLRELVGITGKAHETRGCYLSAMQEVNASTNYWVDEKGGIQFQYFQQYNASAGKQKIRAICNQQQTWLRSPDLGQSRHVTGVLEDGNVKTYILATVSHAVHPAVGDRFKVSFSLYPPKVIKGIERS